MKRAMLNRTSAPLAVYLASLVALVGWSLPADLMAAPVTYTEEAITSGWLGGTSYSDALTTIVLTGDTANALNVSPGVFTNLSVTATVTVLGIGTGTFTNPVGTHDNQTTTRAGFTDRTLGLVILNSNNPFFASYDLTTSIGPISGAPGFNFPTFFPTTLGGFNISSVASDVTYTASVVPLPPSLLLMGSGLFSLVSLAAMRRVRKA